MFLEKLFWKLSVYVQSPQEDTSEVTIVVHNIYYWITTSPRDRVSSNIMSKWQLLYPFLFILAEKDRLIILDIIQAMIGSKKSYAVAVTCAIALTSLFFFLLEPTFEKGENYAEELKKQFIIAPEQDRTSFMFRTHYITDQNILPKYCDKLTAIITTLCREKRVAEQVFSHVIDLILSAHMDSRLRIQQRGLFMSMQIQAQVNFPLSEYNNVIDLLNEYMPRKGDTKMYQITHISILPTQRQELLQKIDTKLITNEPTIVKSKAILLNSLMRETKIVEDQRIAEMRARGVVMVNPKKVQLRIKMKKDKVEIVDRNAEIVRHNESLVLGIISKCGHVDALARQLSKRLNVAFSSVFTYEQYCSMLPKKPITERDVFIAKIFHNYPLFYDFLGYIAKKEPIQLLDFKTCLHSLIVNCIGDWNTIVPKISKTDPTIKNLTERTIQILEYLQDGQWIVPPLSYVIDLIRSLKPAEIVQILLSVFHFVNNYAPKLEEFTITDAGVKRTLPIECDVQVYMQSTKDALRENVMEFASLYSHFFTTSPL